jgi:hypothetical protein
MSLFQYTCHLSLIAFVAELASPLLVLSLFPVKRNMTPTAHRPQTIPAITRI